MSEVERLRYTLTETRFLGILWTAAAVFLLVAVGLTGWGNLTPAGEFVMPALFGFSLATLLWSWLFVRDFDEAVGAVEPGSDRDE